jgi:hypothetical protein
VQKRYETQLTAFSAMKGCTNAPTRLKPQLLDLALSMGEKKFEYKRPNFAETFASYCAIDILIIKKIVRLQF